MGIYTEEIALKSTGEVDMVNVTGSVAEVIKRSALKDGIVTVFVVGATGAVTTIEYEPGLKEDFPDMLERVVPKHIEYKHHYTWHDDNGHSHVRASLLGPSITIPFVSQKLTLGTWQQIVFVELDTRPRHRTLIAQVLGSK
ncbi:MAG: secondary thiamine-phosphate synthase enzyme YjbQ [Candidatus Heimdallarchaeota archaeon]